MEARQEQIFEKGNKEWEHKMKMVLRRIEK